MGNWERFLILVLKQGSPSAMCGRAFNLKVISITMNGRVEQVERVGVIHDLYVLHVFSPIVQEPSFRPALRRLPEGWRVNMTPFRVRGHYSK